MERATVVPRMGRASQEAAVTLGWLGRYRSIGSPRLVMLSGVRAVDLGAVVNVEDMDDAAVFVDPVDDPVGAAAGSVTACERAEQRFADAVRVDRQGGLAEFQHGGGDCLG